MDQRSGSAKARASINVLTGTLRPLHDQLGNGAGTLMIWLNQRTFHRLGMAPDFVNDRSKPAPEPSASSPCSPRWWRGSR